MIKNIQIALLALFFVACASKQPVVNKPRPGNAPASVGKTDSKVMAIFMKATQARLLGETDKAMHLFEEVLKLEPKNHASLFELAKLQSAERLSEQALANAKAASSLDKDNIWYQFLLADLQQQNGNLDGAVKTYKDITERWPNRYEIYLKQADLLTRAGKDAEAERVYSLMEERFGVNDEINLQRYTSFMQAGEYQKALELVDRTLEKRPDDLRYLSMKAEVLEYKGNNEESFAIFERILELDPSNSNVRIAMAEHFYSTDQPEKALEQLRAAFKDPQLGVDSKMQVLLGYYEMSERPDLEQNERERMIKDAMELVELLKENHPTEGKPYTIHGDFLLRESKFKEAREQFRMAVDREQSKFPIWQQLVLLDSRLGNNEYMFKDASEAVELFPNQPLFYLFKGVAANQLKQYDDAIEALVSGKNLVVDDNQSKVQFLSSLGDAYNSAKEYALSDKAFEDALKLDGKNIGVLNNYAYYLSVRNENLERAKELSALSNELSPGNPSYQDTYAWILYRMEDHENALIWIEKAIASGGSGEGVLNEHYGDILYKLDRKDEALEKWKLAQSQGGGTELLEKKINQGKLFE